jgi:uncharacterized protein YjbJ (UPF0337 family)
MAVAINNHERSNGMNSKTRRTPAEVAADASVEHTGKGLINQVKGSVKETWGKVTDNPMTRLEGKMDKVKGIVQERLGRLEGKEAELESGMTRDKKKL